MGEGAPRTVVSGLVKFIPEAGELPPLLLQLLLLLLLLPPPLLLLFARAAYLHSCAPASVAGQLQSFVPWL